MFIKADTLDVFKSQNDIRLAFNNTCFPLDLNDELLESIGIYRVTETKPVYDTLVEESVELTPAIVNGAWTQQWNIIKKYNTPEEEAQAILDNLNYLKTLKVDEINSARLEANTTIFIHNGKRISCDQLSRSDIETTNGIIALYDQMPPGWMGFWKTADNELLPIVTVAEWKEFYTSMFNTGNTNFMHSQMLKYQVVAASSVEELNAIHW